MPLTASTQTRPGHLHCNVPTRFYASYTVYLSLSLFVFDKNWGNYQFPIFSNIGPILWLFFPPCCHFFIVLSFHFHSVDREVGVVLLILVEWTVLTHTSPSHEAYRIEEIPLRLCPVFCCHRQSCHIKLFKKWSSSILKLVSVFACPIPIQRLFQNFTLLVVK